MSYYDGCCGLACSQAGLQGGGEAGSRGRAPGGGARRPQLGGLGEAGGVPPAQRGGRPVLALDQPFSVASALAGRSAGPVQAGRHTEALHGHTLLPAAALGPAVTRRAVAAWRGAAPRTVGRLCLSTFGPQRRTAAEACAMGG